MSAHSLKNNADLEKNFKLPWRSLTWQLTFLTIVPLTILVVIVAFGSVAIHQNAMRTLVGERDERAARTAAIALEEQINHRVINIRSLALQADGVDRQKILTILSSSEYLLNEFDGGVAFFSPTGELISALGDKNQWEAYTDPILVEVQKLQISGPSSFPLSIMITSQPGNNPMVLTLASSPDHIWVAAGLFSVEGMVQHTLVDSFSDEMHASLIIIDASRHLIYERGSFLYVGDIADHPGVLEALNGVSGTTYVQVEGSEHVVAYSPIKSLNWALVMEEPWEMVSTPTLRASQMAPFVLVPVLILAVIALWFGARQIVKPLQTLETKAASLAQGDFKSIQIPVGGIEEIRRLQAELVQMASKVQAAQQSLHGYIGSITTAQEEERRRLARELHDDTIQAMIALKQRVQLTQLTTSHHSPEAMALNEIASLTEQTIENLRRLTRALRPIYLEDLGLVTALEMLARETGQALNIPVTFHRKGNEVRSDQNIELALYRMAQEAFSNIARHAQATRASLEIYFSNRMLIIEVKDNGKGFIVPKNPAEFAPGGHFGLLGLHERAELIGATLEIHSSPGHGTHVIIKLPIQPEEN